MLFSEYLFSIENVLLQIVMIISFVKWKSLTLFEVHLIKKGQVWVIWSLHLWSLAILSFFNATNFETLQERQRIYVTHWSDGNPSDIQISCEVIGVDPTYGFPRICDSSTTVNIYQNEVNSINNFNSESFSINLISSASLIQV